MRHATSKIKTTKQRLALKARAAPYFKTLAPKRVLGYVRKSNGAGFWICRLEIGRDESGAIRRRGILGAADDVAPANGKDVLDYEQARALASLWKPEDVAAAVRGAFTVASAVEQHRTFAGQHDEKLQRNIKRDHALLRQHVLCLEADEKTLRLDAAGKPLAGLGHIEVNKLTDAELKTWRDNLVKVHGLSPASALRVWTNLHSCLQQAFLKKDNGITVQPWRLVKAMKQDAKGRSLHFSNDEAVAIIAQVRAADVQLADYFEALYRTGSRPGGELFALTVGDFRPTNRRLSIRDSSEDTTSKTGGREVALDAQGIALFQRLAAGRPSTAPLLSPDGERHWEINNDRNRIKRGLVAAVQAVMGDSVKVDDIVPYAFRHTFISRRLEAGMPISLVAEHCGTSDYMINKNYAKFCPKETDRWIAETAPQAPALRVAA